MIFYTDEDGVRREKTVEAIRDSGTGVTWATRFLLNANMDDGVDPYFNMYGRVWPIRTHQRQFAPVKTVVAQETGEEPRAGRALDSLVSHGCIISGATVRNSVLSYNVFVHSWATVEESVVMENVVVGRHARIKKAIIAEGVDIPPYTEIGFDPRKDRKRFKVSIEYG